MLPTDLDAQEAQVRALDASHRIATDTTPEAAVPAFSYARQAGIGFEAAKASVPPPQADWGRLVKDHPVLAQALTDPGFASVARDDVPRLQGFEKLIGGWSDAVDIHRINEEDTLHQELSAIGRAQRYGEATPEMLKRADDLEKKLATPKKPEGVVTGVVGSVLSMAPAFGRVAPRVAQGAGFGLLAGGAAGPAGGVAGALTGAGVGLTLGFAEDTARSEQGLSYREFVKAGATPEAAGAAADIVALTNGALMSIPAEKVFNLLPGLQAAFTKMPVKDLMRRLIASPTGSAALARLGGRIAESGVTNAFIASSQELVREIGAIGAGAATTLPADHWTRLLHAAGVGFEQGVGFGILHGLPKFRGDMAEVETAKNRVTLYQTLGDIATNSKLRERMPEAFKDYANRVIQEHGTVEEAKAPAGKLRELFQKEGIPTEEVASKMPEVARQLDAAAEVGDPNREVVIPMADLATHIAPLKSFPELHQDLRIADELTPREAVEAEKQIALDIKNNPKPEGEDATPGARGVYEDVYGKLTAAGRAPEVAAHEAVVWAAFAHARGEKLGVDPLEYYKRRAVNIGASFPEGDGAITLGQGVDYSALGDKAYHGTPFAGFKEFDPTAATTKLDPGWLGEAVAYFSSRSDIADYYAMRYGTGNFYRDTNLSPGVYPARIRTERFFQWGEKGKGVAGLAASGDHLPGGLTAPVLKRAGISEKELGRDNWPELVPDLSRALAQELKARGFDGVVAETGGGKEYAVFDPAAITHTLYQKEKGQRASMEDVRAISEGLRAKHPDVEFDLTGGAGGALVLSKIVAKEKGKGLGSAFMADLVKEADARGLILAASPSVDFGGAKKRIEEFNKRFGFVPNKGKTRNLEISEAMYRTPQEIKATETPAFKKWFGKSKVTDEGGQAIPVYHGTTHSFDSFSNERGNPENHYGRAFYFSNNPKDVAANYAGEGPDLTQRIELRAEQIANEMDKEGHGYSALQMMEARKLARKELAGEGPNTMPVYLRLEKPVEVLPKGGTHFEVEFKTDKEGEWILDDNGDPKMSGNGVKLIEAIRKVFDRYGLDTEPVGDLMATIQEGTTAYKIEKYLRESDAVMYAEDGETGALIGNEVIRDIWKEAGFDGIVMDAWDAFVVRKSGTMQGIEPGTLHYIAFDPKQIKSATGNSGAFSRRSENILKQKAGAEDFRGKISFDDARSYFNITLTGKANLSTFIHESGHAFLEFLRADAEGGHKESAAELAKVREWLGAKEGEEFTTDHLETFAKGFEEYFREGRAPSAGLRETFQAVSSWIKYVYRALTGTGVKLNDDVRAVMDRMLATDSEIEQARKDIGFEPAPAEGMTEAEHRTYLDRYTKALQASKEALEHEALTAVNKTLGTERAKVKVEVTEATTLDPVWNAYHALRDGKRLDGGEIPEAIKGKKLNREAVAAIVAPNLEGAEKARALVKFSRITEADGMSPEEMAPYLGFGTGEELVTKLQAMASRASHISEETNRRMLEKYPEAERAKMAEGAVKALHLDEVQNVLWLEAKAMAKAAGKDAPRTARAVLEGVARRRTGEMTGLEMQPGRFKRAEESAARRWLEAVKAKDFESAHAAKMDQILNFLMWKETTAAREEVDGIAQYGKKGEEFPFRRKLQKAGDSYVEAWDAITAGVEFERQTNKALDRRASLESYLSKMENEDGAIIAIPADLRSGLSLKNYRQMTLDELRTIHAALKNIETMARLKNKLFDGRERRDFLRTATKLGEHIKANVGVNFTDEGKPQNAEWFAKKGEWLRRASAELKKIEFIARKIDGGKTAGWAHLLLFQPLATAEARKNEMYRKIVGDLLKPMKELTVAERWRLDDMVDFLGTPMRRRDVLAVALNLGNEGNRRKLLEGYAYRRWTEEAVMKRVGEVLNPKELGLVNHIWQSVGSLWPEIEALSKRTVGLAPPKVEALPFEINGVKMNGGYYPIVYDRSRSHKGEQIAQRKNGDLFENNFLLPAVSKGFTESRTRFSAPLELSVGVAPAHVNEVIHYLTHYEAVRAVDRLTSNKVVRQALTEGLGREVYNLFRPWLQSIAADGNIHEGLGHLDGIFRHLRVGTTITALGGKVSTALMQALGLTSAMKEIGIKYTAVGFGKFMKEIEFSTDPFRDANEQSPQLKDFEKQMSRELLNDFDNHMSLYADLGHLKDRVAQFSMSFIGLVQKTVNVITWYGAHEKAMAEGHARPGEYADAVVRFSQMGEGIKDKAAIQRGSETTKIFTMMYSYFSVLYNQLTEAAPRNSSGIDKAAFHASKWWYLVVLPVAIETLLRGGKNNPQDGDKEKWAKTLGAAAGSYVGRTVPALSPFTDAFLSDREPRYAPWITTMLQGVKSAVKGGAGHDLSKTEKRVIVDAIGTGAHLPTTAMRNAYLYLDAFTNGSMQEPIPDLLFRPPSAWK